MSHNVSLKYEIFPFHEEIVKSISVQQQGNVLVFGSGQSNDSLRVVEYNISRDYEASENIKKVEFRALNVKSVQSAQLLKWSPNDSFLACAFEKLVIWGYASGDLFKIGDFKDHELEIAAITWAPDSTRIATGSLDGKIVIRQMDAKSLFQKIKEIYHDNKILGLVWDTYDKYLAALYSDNQVIIWKANSWEKSYVVSLTCPISSDLTKLSSKRDDRKIDWSPDYRYVLVPSLDDKIVPFVCALDRQKDFKVCRTFMGPFSSINCVKFNQNLFQQGNCVINIFALGDNDGNISIWGIGEGYTPKKPFFLFKSHPNGNELIEDICWNSAGNMLIATTLKKYVLLALFGQGVFGVRLTDQEKQNFLQGKYGTLRTVASLNTKFKVFKAAAEQSDEQGGQSLKDILKEKAGGGLGSFDKSPVDQFGIPKDIDPNMEVKTSITYTQQKTIVNDGGKKRIIPSKQIVSKVLVEKKAVDNPEQEKKTVEMKEEEVASAALQQLPLQSEVNQSAMIVELSETINEEKNQSNGNTRPPTEVMEAEIIVNSTEDKSQTNISSVLPQASKIASNESNLTDLAATTAKTSISGSPENTMTTKAATALITEIQISSQHPPSAAVVAVASAAAVPLKTPDIQQKLPLPSCLPHIHTMRLGESRFLELETPQNQLNTPVWTQIRCATLKGNMKEMLWTDSVEGRLIFVEILGEQVLYYTTSHLLYFVSTVTGRRNDLPLVIQGLCWLRQNTKKQLLTVAEDGELKVYDTVSKKLIVRENIMFLVSENLKIIANNADLPENAAKDVIENVHLDGQGVPVIFFKTKVVYLYNSNMKLWQKIDNYALDIGCFNDVGGTLSKGEVGVRDAEDLGQFFERVIEVSPGELELDNRKDMMMASKFEERLVYLMRYDERRSEDVFVDTASKYVKKLCDLREFNKIRQFVNDFLLNKDSAEAKFMKNNAFNTEKLIKNVKRILEYFPYTTDLAMEVEEILSLHSLQL